MNTNKNSNNRKVLYAATLVFCVGGLIAIQQDWQAAPKETPVKQVAWRDYITSRVQSFWQKKAAVETDDSKEGFGAWDKPELASQKK